MLRIEVNQSELLNIENELNMIYSELSSLSLDIELAQSKGLLKNDVQSTVQDLLKMREAFKNLVLNTKQGVAHIREEFVATDSALSEEMR